MLNSNSRPQKPQANILTAWLPLPVTQCSETAICCMFNLPVQSMICVQCDVTAECYSGSYRKQALPVRVGTRRMELCTACVCDKIIPRPIYEQHCIKLPHITNLNLLPDKRLLLSAHKKLHIQRRGVWILIKIFLSNLGHGKAINILSEPTLFKISTLFRQGLVSRTTVNAESLFPV